MSFPQTMTGGCFDGCHTWGLDEHGNTMMVCRCGKCPSVTITRYTIPATSPWTPNVNPQYSGGHAEIIRMPGLPND